MRHTTALIIETNNLASLDDHDEVVGTLVELMQHLGAQTASLSGLDELVVTQQGITASGRARVETAAGRAIEWVDLDPATGYYAAKRAGFEATTAEVVVFGDSDCWPVEGWLEALLQPFDDPSSMVVAGRTTYPDDLVGIAATTIDFMFFEGREPGTVRNFYANNVAFRREVFDRFAYRSRPGVYRGHCQVLGMELWAAGVPIRFAPAARTIHELPDSARELARLRLYRGQDTTVLAPEFVTSYGGLARPLASSRTTSVAAVLIGRLGFSQGRLNHQEMPRVRGMRNVAARGVIGAISVVDGAGAILALLGRDLGVVDGNARREVRAYHVDDPTNLKVRQGAPTAAEVAA